MTKNTDSKVVYPSGAGYPYSDAIRAGDFVYVSGQIAFNPDGSVSTGPVEQQTRMVLDKLKAILAQAGCALSDVIKCGCSLADARDFSGFNTVYATYFPSKPPTRTTLVVEHVLDARVEIDCIAYKPLPIEARVGFVYNGLTREDLSYDTSQYPVSGTFTAVTPPWLNDLALVPPDWQWTRQDQSDAAARADQADAATRYIEAHVPDQRYAGATTAEILQQWYTQGMWDPAVFPRAQIDALTQHWISSDAEFARQRFGGANPNVIKRADAAAYDVARWVGGARNGGDLGALTRRLADAQAQGRLFVCDYTQVLGPVVTRELVVRGRHFAAPICFFTVDPESDTVMPAAIQIAGTTRESYIFTPDDPADTYGDAWLLAKLWVGSADQQWWFSGAHLFNAHSISMIFGIAALHEVQGGALSSDHPMVVLAKPFLVKSFNINNLIISSEPGSQSPGIYQKGSFCDGVLPTGRIGVYQIIHDLYRDYRFEANAFPTQMASRGLQGGAIAAVAFPYRDDGEIWWKAIQTFVREIVEASYADDAAVAADAGLSAWLGTARSAFNHDGVTRFSWSPTRASLEGVFTNLLFLCSVQHTAVNDAMFNGWAFTPNGAFAMQAAPPRDAASVTQAAVLASMPAPQSGALKDVIEPQIAFLINGTPLVAETLGVDPARVDRMFSVYPYPSGSAQKEAVQRFWDAVWTGSDSVSARIAANQGARIKSWTGPTPVPNSVAYYYLSAGLTPQAAPQHLNAPVMNAIQV